MKNNISYLSASLEDLQTLRKEIDTAISSIRKILEMTSQENHQNKERLENTSISPYDGLTHIQAIEECLRIHGPQNNSSIAGILRSNGRGLESKHFNNTVYKALKLGEKKGTFKQTRKGWEVGNRGSDSSPRHRNGV